MAMHPTQLNITETLYTANVISGSFLELDDSDSDIMFTSRVF